MLQSNFPNVTDALNEAKQFLSARDTRKYLKRNSARSEILVNRALRQDSENEQLPTSTALPIQTPTYHPLTENGRLVAQNNVTLAQQGES